METFAVIDVPPPENALEKSLSNHSSVPEKKSLLNCCGCINLNNGIRTIVASEFNLLVLATFPFQYKDKDHQTFSELGRFLVFPILLTPLMIGIFYLIRLSVLSSAKYKDKKVPEPRGITHCIASSFALSYGIATVQILNVTLYYIVYSLHKKPDQTTRVAVVLSFGVLCTMMRIYWNVVIYQQRATLPVHLLPKVINPQNQGDDDGNNKDDDKDNENEETQKNEGTVIGIILAMELLLALVVSVIGSWIGSRDLYQFKNVMLTVACGMWFIILIVAFLLGLITVFTNHRIIALLFLITFLFGTVEWGTITLMDFSHRLPGIEPEDVGMGESGNTLYRHVMPLTMYVYAAIRVYFTARVFGLVDRVYRG